MSRNRSARNAAGQGGRPERERLLVALRERVEWYLRTDDREGILDQEVRTRAGELLGLVGAPGPDGIIAVDAEALAAAAWLHWHRHTALDEGKNGEELRTAAELFAVLAEVDPAQPIPPRARELYQREDGERFAPHESLYALADVLAGQFRRSGDLVRLTSAIALFRRALQAAPPDHSVRWAYLFDLADALRTRYQHLGGATDLDEAIAAYDAALEAMPSEHADRPATLSNLGATLLARFERTGNLADLHAAIDRTREALAAVAADDPLRDGLRANLGAALLTRFERTGALADVEDAVTIFRSASAAAAVGDAYRVVYLSNLGIALRARFERTGALADLDEAVDAGRDALAAAPAGYPQRPVILSNLGAALMVRSERMDRLDDLDEGIARLRDAVEAMPADDPNRPARAANLGVAFRRRFERLGRADDLDDAITWLRWAIDGTPPDHPDRALYLANLGASLISKVQRFGQSADLAEAITATRQAVQATSHDHPSRPGRLANLATALRDRFERFGELGDLDEAISAAREAVGTTPHDHPDRPGYLSGLGLGLQRRFQRFGELGDLDEAISAVREAVGAIPPDHPDRPMHLSRLGVALDYRFRRTGELADADEAVTCLRDASDAIPSDHPSWAPYRGNLGMALRDRFERSGRLADLDEAIACLRDAGDATPPDHAQRGGYQTNLGIALRDRFERSGRLADLDEAIAALRDASDGAPPGSLSKARYLVNLGGALHARFERTGDQAALDAAVDADQAAVEAAPPDHPDRPAMLSNLGLALHSRFHSGGRQSDLDEAITCLRDASEATPPNHPYRPAMRSNLGTALLTRSERSGRGQDLDAAIDAFRDANDSSPADHPDRAIALANLGNALRQRFERLQDTADRDAAIDSWRSASGLTSAAVRLRMAAARSWAALAAATGDHGQAAQGFETAVELLPLLAWRGVDRATQEQQLAELTGLASDAAACALRVGQPERAIELLEQGRSVLWAQMLQTRTELSALRQAVPQMADRLEEIREDLDRAGAPAGGTVPGSAGRRADRQMQLAREWDELVEQVRRRPGFAHFLAPTPFAELRHAAAGGPVAVVNVSRYRCDALALTGDDLVVVPLPELTLEDAADRATAFLRALRRVEDGDRSRPALLDLQRTVGPTLAWLWDAVTGPVLDALGYRTAPPPGTAWPRVWWCPTGPLTLLPLHASGYPPDADLPRGSRSPAAVLDRVVSSYTPTLGALLRARRGVPARSRLLAVGMPESPEGLPLRPLPAVAGELEALRRHLGATLTALAGSEALRSRVLDELRTHGSVHLACHGGQDLTDPTSGAVYLYDGPLTVLDIAALQLDGDLAYLSACRTATGGVRLPDEAIHLAGSMQFVGYRQVIATLWAISDQLAPEVADGVYRRLAVGGHLDTSRAAEALHQMVRRVRAEYPTRPVLWAPYMHAGS